MCALSISISYCFFQFEKDVCTLAGHAEDENIHFYDEEFAVEYIAAAA
jgi:hypothetical protein